MNESLRHGWELFSAVGAAWIEWSCSKEIHLGMNGVVGNSSMGQC